MQKVPYLSEITEMLVYRASRARLNGWTRLAMKLEGIAVTLQDAVAEGGDGQTNGQDAGG